MLALAGNQLVDQGPVVRVVAAMSDVRDRLVSQFVPRVSEQPRERRVGADDVPREVDHGEAPGRPIEERAEKLLAVFCLDRHTRHLNRHIDQLDVFRRGQSRFAVIHGKRAEHDVVVRDNGSGPDRAQSIAHRDGAAVLPQRVSCGVLCVHRLAQKGSGPARAHLRRDAQERVDARFVVLGDVRRGGEAQPLLPGVREQHSAAHSLRLLLDQPDQSF